jgi:hypothetical protein
MRGLVQPIHFQMYNGRMTCFASGKCYFVWMPTKSDYETAKEAQETARRCTENG